MLKKSIAEEMIEEAKNKCGKIYSCGKAMQNYDANIIIFKKHCFTIEGNTMFLWYNSKVKCDHAFKFSTHILKKCVDVTTA